MGLITIDLSNYGWETRGDRLRSFEVRLVEGDGALLLNGPDWVADQIVAAAGSRCVAGKLKNSTAKTYTHGFRFKGGPVPDDIVALAETLTEVLCIPAPAHVDFAVTLDWYYQPDDDDELAKTTAGYWVWTTKHATHPEWANSRKSRREMIGALGYFIENHPLYSEATAIIAAPGHLADGDSFGENLARDVAKAVGIPFVESTSTGPRTAQKEAPQDLTNEFTVEGELEGTVIVLDDVFHTGGSASGAAAAARRAGADNVLALTVARTISR